jgi:glycosyltransferase involved in cell wall biosynthesis
MKIAHIAPPWLAIPPKNYGGTEIVIYNLIEEQIDQGHDVTLFAPRDAKTSAKLVSFFPQSLIESGTPWQAHLKAYYHMHKAVDSLKEHDFDIVHTHLSSSADMYIFPLTASLSVPHVSTLHSRFPFDRLPSGWLGDADQYYMEWALSVPMIAISESARAEVPYKLDFIGVVHHGLPMTQFRPTGKKRGDYFVWLGRCISDKGTHLAIQVAKEAGVPIVLAGTVDRDSQDSVHYFQDMVKPLIDNKQVKYIGPVNLKEKIDLLSKARGFLNPIQWEEPFGMVMIEAMALGCPVISFTRGAAPEIIVHQKTGYLVHDVEEMVRFIPRIDEIDREVTRAHVEENFSARVMAAKYVKCYKQVIATKKEAAKRLAITTTPRKSAITPDVVKKVLPVPAVNQVARVAKLKVEGEPRV